MNPEDLKKRTKEFALRVLHFVNAVPRGRTEDILTKQLARAATSIGANYRAACRARSNADFVSKITVAEEEADETQYWLELLLDQSLVNKSEITDLLEGKATDSDIHGLRQDGEVGNMSILIRNFQFAIRNLLNIYEC